MAVDLDDMRKDGKAAAGPPPSDTELLAAEMIERVATTVVPTVIGFLLAVVVASVLWFDTHASMLLLWLAASGLLYAHRLWLVYRFRDAVKGARGYAGVLRRWEHVTMLIGLLWACSAARWR